MVLLNCLINTSLFAKEQKYDSKIKATFLYTLYIVLNLNILTQTNHPLLVGVYHLDV